MIKKFLVGFMAFTLVTVQANAVSNNSLKEAFDDLNYSLSVKWDQTDRAFYNEQIEKFSHEVKELQESGLTNAELIEFSLSNIKDTNIEKDIRSTLLLVQINKMSVDQARMFIMDAMSKQYSQGASWIDDSHLPGLIILLIVVSVAISSSTP